MNVSGEKNTAFQTRAKTQGCLCKDKGQNSGEIIGFSDKGLAGWEGIKRPMTCYRILDFTPLVSLSGLRGKKMTFL
jgi:hypothetical protein